MPCQWNTVRYISLRSPSPRKRSPDYYFDIHTHHLCMISGRTVTILETRWSLPLPASSHGRPTFSVINCIVVMSALPPIQSKPATVARLDPFCIFCPWWGGCTQWEYTYTYIWYSRPATCGCFPCRIKKWIREPLLKIYSWLVSKFYS